MKRFMKAALAAIVVAVFAVPAGAEMKRDLDASGGESEGHWLLIVSKRLGPNAPGGSALMAIGSGGEIAHSFGYTIQGTNTNLGATDMETVQAIRDDEKEPEAHVTQVKLSKEQFEALADVLDKYADGEGYGPPPIQLMDAATEVVGVLEFKLPYRGMQANAMDFYEDIGTLNRNRT